MSARFPRKTVSEAMRLAVAGKHLDSASNMRPEASSDHAAAQPA